MTRCRAVLLFLLVSGCSRPSDTSLTVCAAASVQNSMQELAQLYRQSHPEIQIVFNFGASGMLAQQIEQGVPADIFFSAAPKPMDSLAAHGLILPQTRRDLLRNRIVLIAPLHSGPRAFAELSAVKLVAIGDPASVPAGDYARQVLTSLGLWDSLHSRVVFAKDVRQVLTYVENGDVDAGIVYATDARESSKVRVAETAPENSHTPVVYPVAVLRESRNRDAALSLVQFLAGAEARTVFERHGFTVAP